MEKNFHTVRGYHLLNVNHSILTSSMEDYLEMIFRSCIHEGYIRISQLSDKLNFGRHQHEDVQKTYTIRVSGLSRYGL